MYKTEVLSLEIKHLKYKIHQVTNVDEVFDYLINSSPDDENLKDERIPYWTEIWPSALGLAEFIINNSDSLNGKNIIEIGSGLALPSIVASEYCQSITITDYLEDALNFAKINANENEITNAKFQKLDWRNINLETKYDIVFASDIAYEKRSFEFLPNAISSLLDTKGTCYISEPNRTMAREFFDVTLPSLFNVEKVSQKIIFWRGVETIVNIYKISNTLT
jgi:predicted nicotinamide N-methyase